MKTITNTRYIGILGHDILDLAVYLSMVIKNLQYSINVADISIRGHLLPNQQDSCIYSYKNIDFYRKNPGEGTTDKKDYVIVMADNCDSDIIRLCDSIFVVVDNSFAMAQYLKDIIRSCDCITGIVFRDVTDNGIDSGYIIKHVIKDDYLFKLLKKESIYMIRDDTIDREYKIAIGYEGITGFKNLSCDFLRVICDIAVKITGKGVKEADKALARAKEGEIIEYSILE